MNKPQAHWTEQKITEWLQQQHRSADYVRNYLRGWRQVKK